MRANEIHASSNVEGPQKPQPIASWGRLWGFILIGAGVVALGFLAQHSPTGSGTARRQASSQVMARRFTFILV